MARYAKKPVRKTHASRSHTRSSFPKGLLWLGSLFLGVLAFVGLYPLYERYQQPHPHNAQNAALPQASVEKRTPSKRRRQNHVHPPAKQEAAQRFEFYQLLPGLEVPLPDPVEPAPTVSRPNAAPMPTHNTPLPKPTSLASQKTKLPPVYSKQAAARYMIQAKALRDREGAEQLTHRLKGLGFKARNQMVEAEDGTWFRVMIGPFAQEAIAAEEKKRLSRHQIQGILILQR